MDPLTVLVTLWRHKWAALPVVLLTLAACVYVYLFAPRTYEATVSYALTAPDVPSSYELEHDAELAKLNSDNPYLRSSDSSLLAQVVITKLSDPVYVDQLKEAGFGTDFKIAPVASLGMGLVTVSASSESPADAVETAKLVGDQFTSTLNSVQKVNGADDRYLYSTILVRGPGPAKELFSSRLRSLIMVGIAGSVLLFSAVSVARSIRIRRESKSHEGTRARVLGASEETSSIAAEAEAGSGGSAPAPTRRTMRGAQTTAMENGSLKAAAAQAPASATNNPANTAAALPSSEVSRLVSAGEKTRSS